MHLNGTTKQKTFEDYAIKRAQKCSLKSSKEIGELKKLLSNMTYLLNDGAKRNRLLYLKIMYTAIRKILHLP